MIGAEAQTEERVQAGGERTRERSRAETEQAEPVQMATAAAKKAPKRIIPSRPRLTTPLFSLNTPPSAASTRGGANSSQRVQGSSAAFTARSPGRLGVVASASAQRGDQRREDARSCDEEDREALDQLGEAPGDPDKPQPR